MSRVAGAILPKNILSAVRGGAGTIAVSPRLIDAARRAAPEILTELSSQAQGLSQEEAQRRLAEVGPNVVADEHANSKAKLFGRACINPLVVLLVLLSIVAFATGDARAGTVMMLMVILGVMLRFIQESKADDAAAKLKAMIRVTATVLRDGVAQELPLADLVPGDIVRLAAGDMIPADLRVLSSKDLFLIQASLTGESFPVEKFDTTDAPEGKTPLELKNVCFLGTSVESGAATAIVVETGKRTYLGGMASTLSAQQPQTSFDKGVARFTWLMIRFMLVMVPLVFLINAITKGHPEEAARATTWLQWLDSRNWTEAFFFALAVAVGLTPEMLPMIVTVCLSKGAIAMSHKKVIVKRINSIQNLGAMDILCTDKTGTLTVDRVILEKHCDVVRQDDEGVLVLAYLNSYFQTGLRNVLDRAILDHHGLHETIPAAAYAKLDEVPFDFNRKMMSVVVRTPDGENRLICKGAPEVVYGRCASFELDGDIHPMNPMLLEELRDEYDQLSADGFRVLAIAYKDCARKDAYSREDEQELTLKGYVAFLDPPKETAAPAILALQKHGIAVKVLTGDNELVSKKICHEVGLPVGKEDVLTGGGVEAMSDEQLGAAAERASLFVRLSPAHKQRVIRILQGRGHVVGFMGDGINDSPALRAADVGISVDSAVDIAKEAADAILLEKSLMVLEEGVLEGRKVFANILKYVRMGASSNFGNMFSVLGASIFVPFLPMLPMQILSNNLLYDFSQVPIPTDDVDPEQIAKPRPWAMGEITRFILFIGPCSSIFDYTTYLMMLFVFHAWDKPALFQTGWFVESLLTQTLIIHIIRTNKVPFLQSRASWPLMATSVAIMGMGIAIPFTPLGHWLGFVPLPGMYWPLLILTLALYCVLTQSVKVWLLRRNWIG